MAALFLAGACRESRSHPYPLDEEWLYLGEEVGALLEELGPPMFDSDRSLTYQTGPTDWTGHREYMTFVFDEAGYVVSFEYSDN